MYNNEFAKSNELVKFWDPENRQPVVEIIRVSSRFPLEKILKTFLM